MFGHGGGGWTDLPHALASCSDDNFFTVQFHVVCGCPLLYVAISAKHDLELAAGTTRIDMCRRRT